MLCHPLAIYDGIKPSIVIDIPSIRTLFAEPLERVLREKDDVLFLIRIVDTFTVTITGKEPPAQLSEGERP